MPVGEFYMPRDAVTPLRVEHLVEEGIDASTAELLFRYNFLRYEFPHPSAEGSLWARSYLGETECVSLHLPKGIQLDHPAAMDALAYLRRRFRRIKMLGPSGYEEIWPETRKTQA